MTETHQFSILVVDDDKGMRKSLIDLLQAADWDVQALSRASEVAGQLGKSMPDVILSDVRMPGMSGMELLASLDSATAPPLVLISAHGDIPMAVEAIQGGAYSFVEKPYEPRRLLTILRNAAERSRMQRSNARLQERLLALSGLDRILLGQTPDIRDLRQEIIDIAPTTAPVMILGETGTGKELVARALHDLGGKPDRPFLALNCAGLSPDTFAAEMFGTESGAGGLLQATSGGTLFLDELCACPLPVQAKLLRVIEDKKVLPVGATTPVPVRLRVISATNQDVQTAIADGRLRSDLLFRINTVVLTLPALRQRQDDLKILMAHFLEKFGRVYEVPPPVIEPDDMAVLLAHDWPGNVRELRNVAERRILAARRGGGSVAEAVAGDRPAEVMPTTLREAVAAFERAMIGKAIKAHEGRMEDAATALGIGRRTLNEKIVKLGLEKDTLL